MNNANYHEELKCASLKKIKNKKPKRRRVNKSSVSRFQTRFLKDLLFSHVFRIQITDTLNPQPIFFRQVMGPTSSNNCAFSFCRPVMVG